MEIAEVLSHRYEPSYRNYSFLHKIYERELDGAMNLKHEIQLSKERGWLCRMELSMQKATRTLLQLCIKFYCRLSLSSSIIEVVASS